MQFLPTATLGRCLLAALVVMAGACTMPRSGPTAGEILESDPGSGVLIAQVSPAVARMASSDDPLGFSGDFLRAGVVAPDAIRAGDRVTVTVWENVDTGLLAGVGQKVTALDEIQVDSEGRIFVPYVGVIPAAGRSPDELRREITAALESRTPEPQVEVRRASGVGSTVSVMGAVTNQGVYPIEEPTRRLSSMIAQAGGATIVADVAQVRVERGGRTGSVWLQDLYDHPRNDIALRAGDRIIVEQDRRSFTALGAANAQRRVNFTKRDLSVIEALADAGGLDGRAADPTGVFLFRVESPEVARAVTGRADLVGPQRVAYVLDLTTPDGLFAAREFVVRDEDTIYITEAPLASWSRVLSLAGQAVNFGSSVTVLEGRF
ncbi:polysaccharide biosynthesis/export family protein [Amaricoccus sp.]|uniref:polysaccharide biosynthesis/export family protein n=1 Tax=Amaricoccus sp. TaxID=1872485 RepID=UPI001B6C314F|nr:polysaccharide biosynthesis/export family protein [Amaricoccus sp.]MBP7241769.1 polysaccharide biosynthesis/export family protein [Amaricoccus sp.]